MVKPVVCIGFALLLALSGCRRPGTAPPAPAGTEPPVSSTPAPSEGPGTDASPGTMEVYLFGIGKADAIVITTENHTVLIDAGENRHGPEIADWLLGRGIAEIDVFIITHFHKDHVGGADGVIRGLTVHELIVPHYGKDSKQYRQFIAAADGAGLERRALTDRFAFTLDGADFTVFPSPREYYDYGGGGGEAADDEDEGDGGSGNAPKENDFSLAVSVSHGANHFLFTGDALSARLEELLSLPEITEPDYVFLKVPHHGRHNKRSAAFIGAIRPGYAVITGAQDQPADRRVVAALEQAGAQVFFTAGGGVFCESDGETLTLLQ
ncbi:MAG: MBL fold metallo-hydrolase [Oscillospiraceae bacterium]|nr:MBL fold metallo-hydrolase [Oscillospiraceae bacterium]